MSKIRVFIVDDQEIVRSGLLRLLELEPGIELVGAVGSGEEALRQIPALEPDIVLMDIRMPGMDGVAATQALRKVAPDSKVLILSAYADDYASAIAAGAAGYLAKDISGDELIRALRSVAAGQSAIYLSVPREQLLSLVSEVAEQKFDPDLSDRQREVLQLLTQGDTNAAIAKQLFLSERTIKREVGVIYEKLGVANRAEAVAFAYEHQLLRRT